MRRGLKIAGGVILGLLATAVTAFLTSRSLPEKARFSIDLEALRAAAGPVEGLPAKARAEQVAYADMPGGAATVRAGLAKIRFGFYVWQLVYEDGSTVTIDSVHTKAKHVERYDPATYRDEGWAHQERALAAAKAIAVTHEHHDHLGGIVDSAAFASLAPRLKLTAAQRQDAPVGGVGRSIGGEPTLESGTEGSLHPIAPGVVAISAAGHTPGSQMIYVRLKDGAELLLIGDIAWQGATLALGQPRPMLISTLLREDSEAVVHQLRAILDAQKVNPSLDVVVAHDVAAMEKRFRAGKVLEGLE